MARTEPLDEETESFIWFLYVVFEKFEVKVSPISLTGKLVCPISMEIGRNLIYSRTTHGKMLKPSQVFSFS